MGINVKVDISPEKIAKNKLDNKFMLFCHDTIFKLCKQYVPEDSGVLAEANVEVTKDYVHYKSPYAKYQYYGKVVTDERGRTWVRQDEQKKVVTNRDLKYTKPTASKEWEKTMMSARGKDLMKALEDYFR